MFILYMKKELNMLGVVSRNITIWLFNQQNYLVWKREITFYVHTIFICLLKHDNITAFGRGVGQERDREVAFTLPFEQE